MMQENTVKNQSARAGIAALDRELGLEQYEGDESIYEDILHNFAKNNRGTYNRLVDEMNQNDMKRAHRTAHSLRGAAGTIGAVRLADAAYVVENALMLMQEKKCESLDQSILDEQIRLLEQEFNAVFEELKYKDAKMMNVSGQPMEMSRCEIIGLLDKLAPLLACGDTKCLEYVEKTETVCRAIAEKFLLLVRQIEQYDFEQASETLQEIRLVLALEKYTKCNSEENETC